MRKEAGLSREELADGICSPVSVSRIENGSQMPSRPVLEGLLDKLFFGLGPTPRRDRPGGFSYMELINKAGFAKLVRDYALAELGTVLRILRAITNRVSFSLGRL